MLFNKPHLEFFPLDMETGWHTPPGYPPGIRQKILASDLDEKNRKGSRSRLLRFDAGVFTMEPFVHEFWEEVFLFAGDLTVGSDKDGNGGENFKPLTYAVRPPGIYHGPFKSQNGCMLFEMHYFDISDKK